MSSAIPLNSVYKIPCNEIQEMTICNGPSSGKCTIFVITTDLSLYKCQSAQVKTAKAFIEAFGPSYNQRDREFTLSKIADLKGNFKGFVQCDSDEMKNHTNNKSFVLYKINRYNDNPIHCLTDTQINDLIEENTCNDEDTHFFISEDIDLRTDKLFSNLLSSSSSGSGGSPDRELLTLDDSYRDTFREFSLTPLAVENEEEVKPCFATLKKVAIVALVLLVGIAACAFPLIAPKIALITMVTYLGIGILALGASGYLAIKRHCDRASLYEPM